MIRRCFSLALVAVALLCAATPALAQSTYPTPYGGRVAGVVPLQCDTTGANCAQTSSANPLPSLPANRQGFPAGARTYAAILNGQAGYAASTDLFSIRNPVGSGKVVQVRSMGIFAQATAATVDTITWYKRASLDTGGTPTTIPPAYFDSSDPAPVAVAQVYTAAPTIVDSAATKLCFMTASTSTLTTAPASFSTTAGGSMNCAPQLMIDMSEPITVRPGEELTMNRGGAALPAGYLYSAVVYWTEN